MSWLTDLFKQPQLGYSPNLEPTGWPLLRDMLERKIFDLQANPYGFDPSQGRSMESLLPTGGRGTFNPYSGGYGPQPGQGGGQQRPQPSVAQGGYGRATRTLPQRPTALGNDSPYMFQRGPQMLGSDGPSFLPPWLQKYGTWGGQWQTDSGGAPIGPQGQHYTGSQHEYSGGMSPGSGYDPRTGARGGSPVTGLGNMYGPNGPSYPQWLAANRMSQVAGNGGPGGYAAKNNAFMTANPAVMQQMQQILQQQGRGGGGGSPSVDPSGAGPGGGAYIGGVMPNHGKGAPPIRPPDMRPPPDARRDTGGGSPPQQPWWNMPGSGYKFQPPSTTAHRPATPTAPGGGLPSSSGAGGMPQTPSAPATPTAPTPTESPMAPSGPQQPTVGQSQPKPGQRPLGTDAPPGGMGEEFLMRLASMLVGKGGMGAGSAASAY